MPICFNLRLNLKRFWPVLCLVFVLFIFGGIFLPQTQDYRYFQDDYVILKQVCAISSNSVAAWGAEGKEHRGHPLFIYFFFLELLLWGLKPTFLFAAHLFFHFLNSVLVLRLAEKLGLRPRAAFFAALLFLCSCSFYQIFIMIIGVVHSLALLFFLMAVLTFLKFLEGIRPAFLLSGFFYFLAVMAHEGMVVFPVLAVFMALVSGYSWEALRKKNVVGRMVFLLAVGSGLILFFDREFIFSPGIVNKVSPTEVPFVLFKITSLIRMFVVPIFVWDKGFFQDGFLNGNAARLIPPAVFFVFSLLLFLQKGCFDHFCRLVNRKILVVCCIWIAVTILPFLFSPLTFEHATRYLVVPMVGFSIIFGMLWGAVFEVSWSYLGAKGLIFVIGMTVYIGVLNLGGNVLHYHRYQQYLQDHPYTDYSLEVYFVSGQFRK